MCIFIPFLYPECIIVKHKKILSYFSLHFYEQIFSEILFIRQKFGKIESELFGWVMGFKTKYQYQIFNQIIWFFKYQIIWFSNTSCNASNWRAHVASFRRLSPSQETGYWERKTAKFYFSSLTDCNAMYVATCCRFMFVKSQC